MTNDALVDPFFTEDEFITSALYTPEIGTPSTINVIFDRENSVTPIGPVAIENVSPTAICKTSDVPTVNNKCALLINGTPYVVQGVKPSATGLTTLELSKQGY